MQVTSRFRTMSHFNSLYVLSLCRERRASSRQTNYPRERERSGSQVVGPTWNVNTTNFCQVLSAARGARPIKNVSKLLNSRAENFTLCEKCPLIMSAIWLARVVCVATILSRWSAAACCMLSRKNAHKNKIKLEWTFGCALCIFRKSIMHLS